MNCGDTVRVVSAGSWIWASAYRSEEVSVANLLSCLLLSLHIRIVKMSPPIDGYRHPFSLSAADVFTKAVTSEKHIVVTRCQLLTGNLLSKHNPKAVYRKRRIFSHVPGTSLRVDYAQRAESQCPIN